MPYFQAQFENPDEFLKLIDASCLTPFPNNYFDVIFSEEVLEHIADLTLVRLRREMSRITRDGGKHLHLFPAKWHLVESHLYMPAIHWLPKNFLRLALIYFYVLIGVEPHWKELSHSNIGEKAKNYYQYSVNKTYYRSLKVLENIFTSGSFKFSYKVNYRRRGKKDINGYFPHAVAVDLEKQPSSKTLNFPETKAAKN